MQCGRIRGDHDARHEPPLPGEDLSPTEGALAERYQQAVTRDRMAGIALLVLVAIMLGSVAAYALLFRKPPVAVERARALPRSPRQAIQAQAIGHRVEQQEYVMPNNSKSHSSTRGTSRSTSQSITEATVYIVGAHGLERPPGTSQRERWRDLRDVGRRLRMPPAKGERLQAYALRLREAFGVLSRLRAVGTQLQGACPIHDGSNKRQFTVELQRGLFHCFCCNSGGKGALQFVAKMEHVPIEHAAEFVVQWFALVPPTRPRPPSARRNSMSNNKPSHVVLVPEPGAGSDDKAYFHRVGAAWRNRDGKGFSIQLIPGVAVSGRSSCGKRMTASASVIAIKPMSDPVRQIDRLSKLAPSRAAIRCNIVMQIILIVVMVLVIALYFEHWRRAPVWPDDDVPIQNGGITDA